VCSELAWHGIEVVLSVGAVVSIYSANAYESYDLDFIHTGIAKKTDPVMTALGFAREGRHWRHLDHRYLVEFPPGPVEVGGEIVTEFATRTTSTGVLRLLAPTECAMDRLAAYFHFNDPQGLEQAVQVATRNEVDLASIARWARRQGASAKHREFETRVASGRRRGRG